MKGQRFRDSVVLLYPLKRKVSSRPLISLDILLWKIRSTFLIDCWQSVFLSKFQQGLRGETISRND